MSFVTAYCHINNDKCSVNGKTILSCTDTDKSEWTKQLYKSLQVDYPKFYKMDALAKLAFIASELIKKQIDINQYNDDDIALLFSNKHSSADADVKFSNSYTNESLPSPALFVYTLPNILIGEIAIRNKWYGENLFFISPEFDAPFFQNYCEMLLSKNSNACLCGYINALENSMEAFLFFVEKTDSTQLNLPLTSKILTNLYKE